MESFWLRRSLRALMLTESLMEVYKWGLRGEKSFFNCESEVDRSFLVIMISSGFLAREELYFSSSWRMIW